MDFNKNYYFEQKFVQLNKSKEIIKSKEFEKCIFERCSFVNCSFTACKFIDCQFIECLLSAIKPVNSYFSEIKCLNSKVIGFDWTKAKNVRLLEFFNSQINYSNFSYLKLPGLILNDCEALEADFTEADLTNGNFSGTNFDRARFFKTNLTKANFKKAYNYSIDFKVNKIKKAVFSLPEATSLLKCLDIIIN